MKIGGFDGVMGECARILKKCYFYFGFGFGVCGQSGTTEGII